jgi:hypothetical protein
MTTEDVKATASDIVKKLSGYPMLFAMTRRE